MMYMYYLVLESVAKKYISVIWQAQIHSILPFNPYYEIFISFLTKVMNILTNWDINYFNETNSLESVIFLISDSQSISKIYVKK